LIIIDLISNLILIIWKLVLVMILNGLCQRSRKLLILRIQVLKIIQWISCKWIIYLLNVVFLNVYLLLVI